MAWELFESLKSKKNPYWESLGWKEKHDEKPETSMINEILQLLKELRADTEKQELDQERAEKLKSRIDKIVRQLHKLQSEESGSDSDPESEYESESDSESQYEEWEREKEREMEPVEEVSLESDDPYKLKRPKTRSGDIHFCCGGSYRLLYEPALTGKNPKTMKYLQRSGNRAIDFFNKRNNTNYSVVDSIGAIISPCAGQLLQLGFTAIQPGDADATNFRTKIYYGMQETEIEYVRIDV